MQLKIKKLCKRLKIRLTKKVGKRRVYKNVSVLKNQIKMKLKKLKNKKKRKNNFGSRKSHFGIGSIILGVLAISGLYVGYKVYKVNNTIKKIKLLYPNMPKRASFIIAAYYNYPEKDKENFWKITKDQLINKIKNNRKLNDIQKDKVKEDLFKFIEKVKEKSKEVIHKINELDKINKIYELKKSNFGNVVDRSMRKLNGMGKLEKEIMLLEQRVKDCGITLPKSLGGVFHITKLRNRIKNISIALNHSKFGNENNYSGKDLAKHLAMFTVASVTVGAVTSRIINKNKVKELEQEVKRLNNKLDTICKK